MFGSMNIGLEGDLQWQEWAIAFIPTMWICQNIWLVAVGNIMMNFMIVGMVQKAFSSVLLGTGNQHLVILETDLQNLAINSQL